MTRHKGRVQNKKISIGQSSSDPYVLTSQPDMTRENDKLICIKHNRFYNTENNKCEQLTESSWDKIHVGDKFKYCANNYTLYNPERNSCTTALNDFKYYTAKIEDIMLQKSNNMSDSKIQQYIKLMTSVVTIVYNNTDPIDIPDIKTPEDYYAAKKILQDAIIELTKNLKEQYGDSDDINIRKLKFYKYLLQEDKF